MKAQSWQQAAVNYLARQQQADGSFVSYASPQAKPFVASRQQPTLFPTMLILDALHGITGVSSIRERAAQRLQAEESPEGAWNYWQRASPAFKGEPYPDDLDDTACAVAALTRHDSLFANGARLGSLARLLVASEQIAGGPYNTWLIGRQSTVFWQDIDLAVNANIAYMLSLVGVRPAGLQQYLGTAIASDNYNSSYYIGTAPLLYFLSRGYRGPEVAHLQQAITDRIQQSPTEPLIQALLLSAACRTGLEVTMLAALATNLRSAYQHDHWPAAPLYVDPVYDGQLHYSGSDCLTTALALEALTAYECLTPKTHSSPIRQPGGNLARLTLARGYLHTISDAGLRHSYQAALNHIADASNGQQIAHAATLIARGAGQKLPATLLRHLNLASLNGWLAYTVYDDFLDGEGRPQQLSVANLALRRSYDHFLQALPENRAFRKVVIAAFDGMDSANAWELKHARAVVSNGIVLIPSLPKYSALNQLAQRSWGHSLAASGVAMYFYGSVNHPCVSALQVFFKHFLITRQLNDDAHDWEDDLRAGRLSVVVCWLLAANGRPAQVTLSDDIVSLQHRFWDSTIEQVTSTMRTHLAIASKALNTINQYFSSTVVLQSWLDDLEQSVILALAGRDDTRNFLQAYGGQQA